MDPFATLPSPLLEMTLKLLPDLTSLHSLHNASSAVASLLHEDSVAAEIVETIFSQSGDSCGVPPAVQCIIRTMVLLHWRSGATDAGITNDTAINETPLPSTWDAFTYPISQHPRSTLIPPRPSHYGDVPLPRCTPGPLLCRILALSARIRHLAHRCIHEFIARCMSTKPSHLEDPRFCYLQRPSYKKRQKRPPGKPYQPIDIGAPSWLEEQRVTRGLWWLVLFFDLRDGGAAALGWQVEEQDQLKSLTAWGFWKDLFLWGDYSDLEAVALWVDEATVVTEGKCERLPACRIPFSADEDKHFWCCKDDQPMDRRHGLDWTLSPLDWTAPGYYFGTTSAAKLQYSPLKHVEFKVFHPYGFGIWDMERMEALGFLDQFYGTYPNLTESDFLFTWESILNKQQLKVINARQKAQWHVIDDSQQI